MVVSTKEVSEQKLQIDGVEVNTAVLQIDEAPSLILQKYYATSQKRLANQMFRDDLAGAEYLGEHAVTSGLNKEYNGLLLKVKDKLFALLSYDMRRITYVNGEIGVYRLLNVPKGKEGIFVVDGEEYPIEDVVPSNHFYDRALQHYNMRADDVLDFCRTTLQRGKYICQIHNEETYNPGQMYVRENRIIILDIGLTTAITTYPSVTEGGRYPLAVRDKIMNLVEAELNKALRKEAREKKKWDLLRLKSNIRLAQIEFELYTTTSDKKVDALSEEKGLIHIDVAKAETDWKLAADNTRQHASSLATFY